jgi:hypothetical protein
MGIPAASAQIIQRERYSGTFDGDEVSCGRHVEYQGAFHGVFMLKMRGNRPTPYYFDNYFVHEVFTTADGGGYIIDSDGNYKDLRINHVRGTIYRFIVKDAGQVFTIRTLDGKAIERNRGLLVHTFLMDTKGDSDLSNDVLFEDTYRLVRSAGPHPELTSTDEEFCAAIDAAIAG